VPISRRLPVAAQAQTLRRPREHMSSRKALHVREYADGRILNPAEQEEVANGPFIQPIRYGRVLADAIKRVAKDQRVARHGVKERLDAEMIAGAQQPPLPAVPDGKCEIAQQMFHTALTPGVVRMQD